MRLGMRLHDGELDEKEREEREDSSIQNTHKNDGRQKCVRYTSATGAR